MAHGDAIGDGDGAEFTRRAASGLHALLGGLGLAHQGDVAGRGLIPAAGYADEGLVDFLLRQPHGVIVRAVRRALRPLGDMARRQLRLVEFGHKVSLNRQKPGGLLLCRLSRSSRFWGWRLCATAYLR